MFGVMEPVTSGRILAGQKGRSAALVRQFAGGYFQSAHPAGLGAAGVGG